MLMLKNYCFILGFIYCAIQVKAQSNNAWLAFQGGFGSYHFFDNDFATNYQNQINPDNQHIQLKCLTPISEKRELYFKLGYLIRQQFDLGDTLSLAFSGGYLGIPWQSFRIEWFKKKWNPTKIQLATPINLGTDMGWLWLSENDSRYRNYFLTINLQIEPRLILFQRLIIGLEVGLGYDLTHPDWKIGDDFAENILELSAGGFKINGSIGWVINK